MEDNRFQEYVVKSLRDLAGKSASEIAIQVFLIMKRLGDTEIIIGETYDDKNTLGADLLEFSQSPPIKIASDGIYFRCSPGCKTWHPAHDPSTMNLVFHDFLGNNDAHNKALDEFSTLLKNSVDQVTTITYFCNSTDKQIPIKFIN